MRTSLVRARHAARGKRVKKGGRYDVSMLPEAQFEAGSRRRVLRNLLGIRTVREMNVVETRALQSAMDLFNRRFDADHRFTAEDICGMHRMWLEGIYEWAGEYRSVNVSKDGFPFAAAGRIPALMANYQRDVLARHTPCRFSDRSQVVEALAEVHVEFLLIHPFRDGNGRVARALATLMAAQAGLPQLDFTPVTGKRRPQYFAAVQAGMDRNYRPMEQIFAALIERSLAAS
ncbi:MAG: cell filamentation protein Fic [Betaproteobacteria bacterium]|nr:MAG: cell filamentation protein Fic [Betaproteobacteria bacterium]